MRRIAQQEDPTVAHGLRHEASQRGDPFLEKKLPEQQPRRSGSNDGDLRAHDPLK
jgi:hypothetical protein